LTLQNTHFFALWFQAQGLFKQAVVTLSFLPCNESHSKQVAQFSFLLYFSGCFSFARFQKVRYFYWSVSLSPFCKLALSINCTVLFLFLIRKVITGIFAQHAHLLIARNFRLRFYSYQHSLLAKRIAISKLNKLLFLQIILRTDFISYERLTLETWNIICIFMNMKASLVMQTLPVPVKNCGKTRKKWKNEETRDNWGKWQKYEENIKNECGLATHKLLSSEKKFDLPHTPYGHHAESQNI